MVTSPMTSSVCYIRGHFGSFLLGAQRKPPSALFGLARVFYRPSISSEGAEIQFNKRYIPAIGSDKAL